MAKGLKKIYEKLPEVDAVIQVHDARVMDNIYLVFFLFIFTIILNKKGTIHWTKFIISSVYYWQ